MSWQSYVDQNLIGTGKVSKAAIHGHDGNPWATSSGFNVTADEVKALMRCFDDQTPLYQTGIVLGGNKYMFLRANPGRSLMGRKGGDAGCIVVKTNQAVLVGVYEGGLQGGDCNLVVENLADYLVNNGY
eukprot:m.32516 g.32516  ORF g.32516 m.32516 type:complete len:129 (-) comp10799_c0_seq1:787-1173(-)